MFNVIIIDDEQLAIDRLKRLLIPYDHFIKVIAETTCSEKAIELINKLQPDLIFLDIQMPEFNGFRVLNYLSYTPLVIFITAYDKYALKAFETNSIDYLLKPIDASKLKKAMDKLQSLTSINKTDYEIQLINLLDYLKESKTKRLKVKSCGKIFFLNINDIYFFKSSDRYIEINTIDKCFLNTGSLKNLELELDKDSFLRVHRSAIINVNYIESISRMFNGEYRIKMKDSKRTQIPVSKYLKHKLEL